MMAIRAIIVDDEPLGRARIRDLLAEEEDVEVVTECETGTEAVRAIEQHRPDLVFLDIQMPELDGFGAIEALGAGPMPAIIFVTAYDQFALKAFDAHALDYLLKPFDDARFRQALDRSRALLRQRREGDLEARMHSLLATLGRRGKHLDRIVVRSGLRSVFVATAEIDWIEADGKYVRLHVKDRSYLHRDSLTRLEAVLDPELFTRIHRSIVVNSSRIREVESLFQGEYAVVLKDGTKLTSGRSYRRTIQALLGKDA
jgi:two-component system, LytTR family, response regulator